MPLPESITCKVTVPLRLDALRTTSPLRCETQCVRDQIVEHLRHPFHIYRNRRQRVRGVHTQQDALLLGRYHISQPGAFQQCFGIDGAAIERQLTGIGQGKHAQIFHEVLNMGHLLMKQIQIAPARPGSSRRAAPPHNPAER